MVEIDINKFKKLKDETVTLYKTFGNIKCPYLNAKVAFTTKGLKHLEFKGWNRSRPTKDQYMRLRLLKFAPEIIKKSNTLQEYLEINHLERIQINSRWENKVVFVKYYGFIAIINQFRIKVIIKQVEGGDYHFWSIIPCWKQNDENLKKKIFHDGDLESD